MKVLYLIAMLFLLVSCNVSDKCSQSLIINGERMIIIQGDVKEITHMGETYEMCCTVGSANSCMRISEDTVWE